MPGNGVSVKDANDTLVCIVRFGPSLLLANYVPTLLLVRAELKDGTYTEYQDYDDFVYPTKMMTVSDVRKLYRIPKDYVNADVEGKDDLGRFQSSPIQRFHSRSLAFLQRHSQTHKGPSTAKRNESFQCMPPAMVMIRNDAT